MHFVHSTFLFDDELLFKSLDQNYIFSLEKTDSTLPPQCDVSNHYGSKTNRCNCNENILDAHFFRLANVQLILFLTLQLLQSVHGQQLNTLN